MKVRRISLLPASALLVPLLAGGTSSAEPVLPATPFHVRKTSTNLEVSINDGTFALVGDRLVILSRDHRLVSTLPLSFRLNDYLFPVTAKIDGDTATITPSLDVAQALYRPVSSPANQQAAQDHLNADLAAGAGIGLVVGTAIGAVGGCLLGAGIGAVLGGLATVLGTSIIGLGGLGVVLIPANSIVGCVGGKLTGILGAVAGAALDTSRGAIYFFTTTPPPPAPIAGPGTDAGAN